MPRRARIALANVPLHVIQRGNNRQACFFADDDYLFYLDQLRLCAQRAGCAIHSYVLMTNHVHLLLTPRETNAVGHLMKLLGQRAMCSMSIDSIGAAARCGKGGSGHASSRRTLIFWDARAMSS